MKVTRIVIAIIAVAAILVVVAPTQAKAQARFQNFALLVDQSNEMNVNFDNKSKNHIARQIAKDFVEKIPNDIPLQGAIYMYGIMAAENENKILRIQKLAPFNSAQFKNAMKDENTFKAQTGPSSLSIALREVGRDFKNVSGRTVVVIISGGNLSDVGEPSTEAIKLRKELGKDNVCFWTILVGKNKQGGKNLQDIKDKTDCGHGVSGGSVDGGGEMKRYVAFMFYGVKNDNDVDGVPNDLDKCPNTPYGASVDSRGCWVVNNINFDSGKADIKPEYYSQLEEIAAVMNVRPNIKVLIIGHTDSQGDDAANQALSERRANAVMNHLVNAGVDAFRLRALGKGESEPTASNDTAQGRAENRRIEFQVQD